MGVAIVHVVGALLALVLLGILAVVLGAWELEYVKRRRLQEASIALGVSATALDADESMQPRLLEYLSRRCSSELLCNRLSDLSGLVRTAWGWLGALAQVGIVLGVAWSLFSEGRQTAIVMWAAPAAAVFFWLVSVLFSYACLVLTGRYPGEAKEARKSLAAFIEQRKQVTAGAAGVHHG